MITKSGVPMINHFAHNAKNATKCSGYNGGESEEHLEAKKYVADNIEDFRFIDQSCDSCDIPNKTQCVRFSKDYWRVLIEWQIKGTAVGKGKSRRADVLLQIKSNIHGIDILKPWYSIEIRHSHAVSEDKTKALHRVECGIIEVLASDVLGLKGEDKPFYIRNVHNLCRIPWTCKRCTEVVANERVHRWVAYEEWYKYQWVYQDRLIIGTRLDEERSLKRECLQAQAFELMGPFVRTVFRKTLPKCRGKCVACTAWILHENYCTFYADDYMADSEVWWWDAIRCNSYFRKKRIVYKMVFCNNCIWPCLNCETIQPFKTLQRFALCRFCNTDNQWFDTHIQRRLGVDLNPDIEWGV